MHVLNHVITVESKSQVVTIQKVQSSGDLHLVSILVKVIQHWQVLFDCVRYIVVVATMRFEL